MNLKWNKMLLEDVTSNITDGKHGDCENQDRSNFYFVSVKDVYDGAIHYENARQITESDFLEVHKRTKLESNDILITNSGTIGRMALVKDNELTSRTTFQKSIAIIKPRKELVNPEFLYYYLLCGIPLLSEFAGGTTQKNLLLKDLRKFEIYIPDLFSQKKIVSILSSIDKKIELNNKINDNLEQMAQAIFKSWFIDFDPFKDEKFVESELGLIPEGWKVVKIGDITVEIREKVKKENLKVFSAVKTGDLILSEEYFTKKVYSEDIGKYIIVKQNDFAYNPARVNIGSLGMNNFDFDGCVSPVYVVFRTEESYHNYFNMYFKTQNFKQEVILRSSGSVRQSMNYKDFSLIEFVYPSADSIKKFNEIYISLINIENQNNLEIEKLIHTRDFLLPKLISGEIDVSQVKI